MSRGKNKRRPVFPLWPDETKRWFGIEPPPDAVACIRVDEGKRVDNAKGVLSLNGRVIGTIESYSIAGGPEGFAPIKAQARWLIFDANEYRMLDVRYEGIARKTLLDRVVSQQFAEKVKKKLYARGSDPAKDIERLGDALSAIEDLT